MDRFGALFIWILSALACVQCVKVSFYGASHVAMPLQEAKLSTNIRLRFRSHQENALILLAAGRTDYCMLGLDAGRIKFSFKVDDFMAELWSPKTYSFNDLEWHDVAIQRYETNVTLQIDEHFARKSLPPRITEFNVHFGVFLGGFGDFSESYLSSVDNFRGCISDVYYNNINVLKRAKERTSHVSSVQVSWTCSNEFDATEQQSISFVEDDSFVMLQRAVAQTGERWSFELRTIETLATIMYNSGPDFVGLEIVDARLRFLVRKGSNVVELVPERNISDGKWHNVTISYSPINVELSMDDSIQSASFANGSSQIIELGEEYYLGGIAEHRKRKAFGNGLRSVEQSMRGCIRNCVVNNETVGFPQTKVTHGVDVECGWSYPCLDKSPCIVSSTCQQHGVNEFNCYCDQAYCIRADYSDSYKIFTRSDLPIEFELLAISPLQVLEGDSIFLSPLFVDVLIDYAKFNIMEAGVVFNIVQPPKHGKVLMMPFGTEETTNSTSQHSKFFSLIDLSTDKIKYTHNGLEQLTDHITIDLQLISANNREPLPDFLQGKHRFVLHANITPVNDAPVLTIPNNRIFRLTQGIPKNLGPDILLAEDPDSPAERLMYSIVAPSGSEAQHCQIEVLGKSVTTFSQADVNQGTVTYMINSENIADMSFELSIQVSDGMETSAAALLSVYVMPLQLRMINNTGLILVHKSAALITPWNLSFVSNSDDDNIDVKYAIVQTPIFGYIQKFRIVDSSWITVDSFNSEQIALGHVRYIHNTDIPVHDEFKFVASFSQYKTIKYDFRLTFTKLQIGIQIRNSLLINGTRETVITPLNLFHQTTPLTTFARNIIYTVIKPPAYGQIYVDGHPEYAKEMDSFTQQDLDENLIIYKTHRTCYSSFVDRFEFLITVPECEDVRGSLKIIYNPPAELVNILSYQIREKIQLNEGDRALLTRRNFQLLFNKFNYLLFKISTAPTNGRLCNVDVKSGKVKEIDYFTLENLYLDDIYYCHDDSETTEDTLYFLVLSDEDVDFQYVCEVLVVVRPLNDNGPYRLTNVTFHVVRNETKLVSSQELTYLDPDLNTNATDIVYGRVLVSNGELYNGDVKANEFSQDDIDHSRIWFKHTEADVGTITFSVTDGTYHVDGSLKVLASDPFIKVADKNASVVQEGKYVALRMEDLSIETNVNAQPDEIEYRILDEPDYGVLKILRRKFNGTMLPRATNITSIKNFTQQDVERERLIYWNTAVASMEKIRYRVSTKGIWAESEILIRIYPAAYWDLLQIRRNQTLYVEESTSVKISRDILEIVHPNISPGDITYLVTTSPQHGYLEIQSITSDDEYNCKVFDQSTINSEKMFYIQAGVNQSSDYFVFDVTNGITWLRDLVLKIVIIPENLYIRSMNITVEEGKLLRFEPEYMMPFSEYYVGKILEYKIVQQPVFGHIKSGKSKVNRFTFKQLESGQVHYLHDGSENATDVIRFIAITRNKESVPFDVYVNILPVNDEMPQIVTNTGLHMWIGGHAIIRNTDLMAKDYDTAPQDMTFTVSDVAGGSLQSIDQPNVSITNFTQLDIDNEKIMFVHESTATLSGKIVFSISDGDHTIADQVLNVVTNPVSLELVHNENLHVFPLTRKQILPDQLNFRCTDEMRQVRFVITIPPQTGRILYEHIENGSTHEVTEFTQLDVSNGRILYEHTHTMVELKSNDSFYFDVTAKFANSLMDQIFNIEVSVSSGGLLRFLPVPRLYLDEGETAPIRLDLSKVLEYLETRAKIQLPELYIDSYPPEHGRIEMIDSTHPINGSHRYLLSDFNAGKIFYRHDHSDTVEDKIRMSVFLVQGQIFLCNLTLPVVINPVNDQPFNLVTQSPQMTVVEGENRTITRSELLTEDMDTEPGSIVYDIISGPTLGALIKISDEGVAQDILTYGNQFTQLDINEQRIQYMHFGVPQSTTIYFKVSDGKFKPACEIFNLRVLPVTLSSGAENEMLSVQQGSNLAVLESKHLSVDTNAAKCRLVYNVTHSPSHGYILVDNKASSRFTQAHLDGHQVNYMQTDMNQSSDSFKIIVFIPDTNHSTPIAFDVKIIVEPFIKINGISITSSDKIRLTSTVAMDNPTQVKLNRYNPKIVITRKPDHGKIRKIIRTSGDSEQLNDKDVNSFTYKELRSGIVYFVARQLPSEVVSINDYFEYSLHIKSVQPGQGFVPIEIHKVLNHPGYGDGIDGASNETNDVNVLTYEAFPFNYVVIVSMIVIMLVLGMLMVILIRCRSNGSLSSKSDSIKDYPPPLPRPPDFMALNNNHRLYSSSEAGDSMPVTASSTPLPVLSSIPHCKVIPIDLDDSESDGMNDMNMDGSGQMPRYPYGDDNDEWSSSCDVGPDINYASIAQPQQMHQNQQRMNNPLLRRNQYWV